MIYLNVGEMCFNPMNIHNVNEQFNGFRQLRSQHISPVGLLSTCSTCFYPAFSLQPPSLFLSLALFLWYPSRFLISGLSLLFGDVDVFFLQSKVFCSYTFTIQTDAVVPSSDHCRTETVLPPSDHYCIDAVAPSGDRYCIGIAVPSSDHCRTETVPPSSDRAM